MKRSIIIYGFLLTILVFFIFQGREAHKYGKDLTLKVYYQIISDYGLKPEISNLEYRLSAMRSSIEDYYYGIMNENVPCPSAAKYLPRLKTAFYLGLAKGSLRIQSPPPTIVFRLVKFQHILSLYFDTNISYAEAIKQYPIVEMVREAGNAKVGLIRTIGEDTKNSSNQYITLNDAFEQSWRGRDEYLKLLPADKLALIRDGLVMYRRINQILLSLGFTTKQIDDFMVTDLSKARDYHITTDYYNNPTFYLIAYIVPMLTWFLFVDTDSECYKRYLRYGD